MLVSPAILLRGDKLVGIPLEGKTKVSFEFLLFPQLDDELKEIWFRIEKDSYHTCFNSLAWVENYILS